jgi:hypothetical protein
MAAGAPEWFRNDQRERDDERDGTASGSQLRATDSAAMIYVASPPTGGMG